jgi:hypothetical protein
MKSIKIVSEGDGFNTKVIAGGIELQGMTCIKIQPMLPGKPVKAEITFTDVELEVGAELIDNEETDNETQMEGRS